MITYRIKAFSSFILFLLVSLAGYSQLKLPSIFSDHMVVQRNTDAAIWGQAEKGSTVTLKTSWNKEKYTVEADETGAWKTRISTPEAGGPYTISISSKNNKRILQDVYSGEVWLCAGQSNMEMPMKGFPAEPVQGANQDILESLNNQIRFISVPRKGTTQPQKDFEGEWKTAHPSTVAEFSATAYYFGEQINKIMEDVPVGLVEVSYGGSSGEAWMDAASLKPYESLEIPSNDEEIGDENRTPTTLYNGMLYPVIGYTLKGAIWYQGESNHMRPFQYEKLFPDMVKLWREKWDNGEFPFFYAQIAPFAYQRFYDEDAPAKYNSAYLRDAQRKAMYEIPNSGMAVLMDAGEDYTIHPPNKQVVGERLAYLALGKTYGIDGIGYAAPDYDSIETRDSTVVVTFKNAPRGITSYGKEVTTFEIAGPDKKFYPAKATLKRESVVLHSPEVDNPVAVRYAFDNYVEGQLFNTNGIPVSSFRTDDW